MEMALRKTQILDAAFLAGLALPAYADHGRLATTDRDAWINLEAADLVTSGLVAAPDKPIAQMTNLEVAQLAAQAARGFYAQATLPPPLPGGD
ncbi:MAG TPA: hypothetical protein VJ873_10555, partial [bacterium]|nr:hypothetical protein [bacterium]